jgi:integrase
MTAEGRDPAEERARTADPGPDVIPFAHVAREFINRIAVGPDETRPLSVPKWGKRPIAEITTLDVNVLIKAHVTRGCRGMARDLLTIVRRVFGWAIGTGEFGLTQSPCTYVKPSDIGVEFSDSEIRACWNAADEQLSPWRAYFQLASLTGVRRSGLAIMVCNEIDWHEKAWRIPAQRMKMNEDHCVPLTNQLLKILERLHRRHRVGWKYVMTSSKGRRGLTNFNAAQVKMQKAMGVDWTLHDCRRVIRLLAEFPNRICDGEVAESILVHSKRSVKGVYNTAECVEQKRIALETWEVCLLDVAPGKSLGSCVARSLSDQESRRGGSGLTAADSLPARRIAPRQVRGWQAQRLASAMPHFEPFRVHPFKYASKRIDPVGHILSCKRISRSASRD